MNAADRNRLTPKSHQAYAALRRAILDCRLPGGSALFERDLVEQIGVSRTSVRAALARLISEGLVQRTARGASVAPIDVGEVREILSFMKMLETTALAQSTPAARGALLPRLKALLADQSATAEPEHFVDFINAFHKTMVALAGNSFFDRAFDDALTRIGRAAWIASRLDHSERTDLGDYAALIDMALTDRHREASALLGALIERVGSRMVSIIEGQQQSLATFSAIGGHTTPPDWTSQRTNPYVDAPA